MSEIGLAVPYVPSTTAHGLYLPTMLPFESKRPSLFVPMQALSLTTSSVTVPTITETKRAPATVSTLIPEAKRTPTTVQSPIQSAPSSTDLSKCQIKASTIAEGKDMLIRNVTESADPCLNVLMQPVKLEPELEQFGQYVRNDGPIKADIRMYEHVLETSLKNILSYDIIVDERQRLYVTDIEYQRVPIVDSEGVDRGPMTAIAKGDTYRLNVLANWHHVELIVDARTKQSRWTEIGTFASAREKKVLFELPLMVGSKWCWTQTILTLLGQEAGRVELLRAGISDIDPLGYFVIDGRRRVFKTQEKLMSGRIFTSSFGRIDRPEVKKSRTISQITIITHSGTQRIQVLYNLNSGQKGRIPEIVLSTVDFYKQGLNVYRAYRILCFPFNAAADSVEMKSWLAKTNEAWAREFEGQIQKILVRPDRWQTSRLVLDVSRLLFSSDRRDDVTFLNDMFDKKTNKFTDMKQVYHLLNSKFMPDIDEMAVELEGAERAVSADEKLTSEAGKPRVSPGGIPFYSEPLPTKTEGGKRFPVLTANPTGLAARYTPKFIPIHQRKSGMSVEEILHRKLDRLAELVAGFIEVVKDIIPEDDLNDFSNKRFDSPARMCEHLCSSTWHGAPGKYRENRIKGPFKRPNTISAWPAALAKIMERDIKSSFNGSSWGSSCQKHRVTNVVGDQLLEAPTQIFQQVTEIRPPLNTHKSQRDIRMRDVQFSQTGFVDVLATPENEQVGLVKYKGLSSRVSVEQPALTFYKQMLAVFRPSRTRTAEKPTSFYVNGMFCDFIEPIETAYIKFMQMKRKGEFDCPFPYEVTHLVVRDTTSYSPFLMGSEGARMVKKVSAKNKLHVFNNGGRPLRPLAVAVLQADELRIPAIEIMRTRRPIPTIDEMIRDGFVDLVDPSAQKSCYVAQSYQWIQILKLQWYDAKNRLYKVTDSVMDKLRETNRSIADYQKRLLERAEKNYKNLTHCEIDPQSILGITSAFNPLIPYEAAPRGIFQTRMSTYAMGCMPDIDHNFSGMTTKVLMYPERPIFETQVSDIIGLTKYPAGAMVMVALMSLDGNQEDGIVANEDAFKRGLFQYLKFKTIRIDLDSSREYVAYTPTLGAKFDPAYAGLQETGKYAGIIKEGAVVKPDDVLVNIGRRIDTKRFIDQPARVPPYEGGVVDRVRISETRSKTIVRVRIKNVRIYSDADKLTARYAQKGVTAVVKPAWQLPTFIVNGEKVKPELIINPLAIPSRLTIGFLIEMLMSTAGAVSGQRFDASSFRHQNIDQAIKILTDNGLPANMMYPAYMPLTGFVTATVVPSVGVELKKTAFSLPSENGEWELGARYAHDIVLAPMYYQAMPMHVVDKIQVRNIGKFNEKFGQPRGHRETPGGQTVRFGEMETTAIASHGAASVLADFTCTKSDGRNIVVCTVCHEFMEPRIDTFGVVTNYCTVCKTERVEDAARIFSPAAVITLKQVYAALGISLTVETEPIAKSISR